MNLEGKRILVTGGTGSLGRTVIRRLLTGENGMPAKVTVFSRDEAKQHYMRLTFLNRDTATDEVIYRNFRERLGFQIGDIRDYSSVIRAVKEADIVVHAAALKQVPTCEYFPYQAVQTNVLGAANVVRAVCENDTPVDTVIGISTDKACKPINAMGMTKALLERIFVEANIQCPNTRFVCVRYGNVIASRGSVIPLFLDQIGRGGPVTVTTKEMTRFLLTLDRAVDTVFAAIRYATPGEIFVPKVPAARILDLAHVLVDGRNIPITFTGIRPGEKIHEIMVSEEEVYRTVEREGYYVICPMLPELHPAFGAEIAVTTMGEMNMDTSPVLTGEYSSSKVTLDLNSLRSLIAPFLSGHALKEESV